MNRVLAFVVAVVLIVLAVSVWKQLQPTTQGTLLMAWSGW